MSSLKPQSTQQIYVRLYQCTVTLLLVHAKKNSQIIFASPFTHSFIHSSRPSIPFHSVNSLHCMNENKGAILQFRKVKICLLYIVLKAFGNMNMRNLHVHT